MKHKILITGAGGQLAQCFRKIEKDYPNYQMEFRSSAELDITDSSQVEEVFQELKPKFCINTAAYTLVDKAEEQPQQAYAVNQTGVKNLAEAAAQVGTHLIHISTDYVFDGDTRLPYSEDDFTNPSSIYGKSKLAGEREALENPKNIVIRTSWLYSEFGKNFVKTMLALFQQKEELNIVNDQYGQPTNANDLAQAIMTIIQSEKYIAGLYHFSNYPETTWYQFAEKIKEYSGAKTRLNPITTEQYPTPAQRPHRSTLCLDKIEENYNIELQHWQNSLENTLKILITNE